MAKKQAFEGIKIADFTWSVVGPMVTQYFSNHGATVVRVESHGRLDILRLCGPYRDNIPGADRSGWFNDHNTGKLSMVVNLDKPRGKDVIWKLIKWSDIVTESLTPGVMKKWGVDYESVSKVRPDIIYLSSCLQGQYGPHAHAVGYGPAVVALTGIAHLSGWPDRGPSPPSGAYADYISPRFGAAAVIAALDYRRRTGKGTYIEQAQSESTVHFMAPPVMDYAVNGRVANRNGNRLPYAAPHGAFPCQGDDEWCAITVFNDTEWNALCQAMGRPTLSSDPRFATFVARKKNEDALESVVAEWTSQRPRHEVMETLQKAGVPAGVVNSMRDLYETDLQLKHRKHFRTLDHPVIGKHRVTAPAFTLSKTPCDIRRSPVIGEHTEHVYHDILGMSDDEIAELLIEGVITTEADLPQVKSAI